ncbi:hypothetical protein AZF37_00985 [endosymbiont 'TC1' of Trimyema compressum]|uniref:leucine-rich repeat domain-containing protein n=1 Tax=endosymbiont 'TC1' of Trimyema compressum TaxID=243899 RepID=UPI0007F06864|nr:hypothetical protein [endosymbiont 'TC1' of Trimyema compressum]AMP19943.1 hypothetical protein AZF37_00985 [endosymbiont 'TC1' of Trimyema compressum]
MPNLLAADNVTFEQQFPDTYTATIIAGYFGKNKEDVMDASFLSTTDLMLNDKGLANIDGIEIFTNLHTLELSNNKITTLPESLSNLTTLTWLNFSANKVTKLPENIGNLSNLNYICASDNQITSLPISFNSLPAKTEKWFLNNLLPVSAGTQDQLLLKTGLDTQTN